MWEAESLSAGAQEASEELAECLGIPASKSFALALSGFHFLTAVSNAIAFITEQFDTRDFRWSPDGRGLILLDRDSFCCAFQVEEDPLEDQEEQEPVDAEGFDQSYEEDAVYNPNETGFDR